MQFLDDIIPYVCFVLVAVATVAVAMWLYRLLTKNIYSYKVLQVSRNVMTVLAVVVIIGHPFFVTYPSLPGRPRVAEVMADGSLRTLPFGALNHQHDGKIVSLDGTKDCLTGVRLFYESGVSLEMNPPWPRVTRFAIDNEVFYRKYGKISREDPDFYFCREVALAVHEIAHELTSAKLLPADEHTDGNLFEEKAGPYLSQALLHRFATSGVTKVTRE